MITPRATRLLRVPDLQTLHRTLAGRICPADPLTARQSAVIVPTRAAAEALRRTLEALLLESGRLEALILPELLTRADFYAGLHAGVPGIPEMLSDFERGVLLRRATRRAEREAAPPFRLRPGLIVEILSFYDELHRRERTVADFARLITDSLAGSVDFDRGAERLLRLTRFLTAAFSEFERSVDATCCLDEHGLRRRLLVCQERGGFRHVVVTVADQPADPLGLWAADFTLLACMPGIERIDVIATENVLAAGFHERIRALLPGIDEERCGAMAATPALVGPPASRADATPLWSTSRDREEELADVARAVKTAGALDRVAVVFQRPLPYLYLARTVFPDAEVPYQAVDALPLAAEPFAAALDLVFTFAATEGSRAALVELLASPHWRFAATAGGTPITRADVAAADRLLRELKYFGGWDLLGALAAEGVQDRPRDDRSASRWRRASAAIRAAAAAAEQLRSLEQSPSASRQIETLLAFVRAHERLPLAADAWHDAHMRARAAVLGALQALARAHAHHDDGPVPLGELVGTIRRWIEGQTFSPRTGSHGITLLDARSAAFAGIDDVRLVGLVESDWPDRGRRNIFYPASLLSQLGWPSESDRLWGARARFRDLLRLPRKRLFVSSFTLEDDAIVPPSMFLEELELSGLPVERPGNRSEGPLHVFVHEALSHEPIASHAVRGFAAAWLAVRVSRSSGDDPRFHGAAGPGKRHVHAVSHVERYLECPFKYFSAYVLRLEEERDQDESGLSPQQRGQLLHDVFERFFAAWHAHGRQTITADDLDDALALFEAVAEDRLAAVPETDRALERTHLLGSAASPGLAERAFSVEIEHGVGVMERLLEYPLEGEFDVSGDRGPRRLSIKAKADRIDLLSDGTLRVIDYKLGRAPKPARALQLPIYGACAAQHLEGRHGRTWTVSRAGYIAFREKNPFMALGGSSSLQQAMDEGQRRFLAAIDSIEAGTFPPRPDEPFICTRCGYAPVCRKDYVGDE